MLSAFWDVMPTLADLAGVSVPPSDGISFLPALLGNDREQKKHEYLYWEFTETGAEQAIIRDEWKLISFPVQSKKELYNLKDDPGEINDLSSQYPGRVKELDELFNYAHTQSDEFKLKSEK